MKSLGWVSEHQGNDVVSTEVFTFVVLKDIVIIISALLFFFVVINKLVETICFFVYLSPQGEVSKHFSEKVLQQ